MSLATWYTSVVQVNGLNKILRMRIVLPGKTRFSHISNIENIRNVVLRIDCIHVQHFLIVEMSGSYPEDQELPCNKLKWTSC